MPREETVPQAGEVLPQTASQDLTLAKQAFMQACVTFAGDMLAIARRADELTAYYFANFQGAAAITQTDVPTSLAWLTPTIVTNIVTQAQLESNCATGATSFVAGTISAGVRDQLRQACGGPRTAG